LMLTQTGQTLQLFRDGVGLGSLVVQLRSFLDRLEGGGSLG
jgi:hypothetical protein